MYPGGTWIGGIDPFGDIMGTSAGPGGEKTDLRLGSLGSEVRAAEQNRTACGMMGHQNPDGDEAQVKMAAWG